MAAVGRQITNTQINRNIRDTKRIINSAIQLDSQEIGIYWA